jgi:uncharacterized protein YraI
MKQVGALIVAALIGAASSGNALCYVCNRSDWVRSDYMTKTGFAAGVITQATVLFSESPLTNMYRMDLSSCVLELNLYPSDFVRIIDQQYEDLANWEQSPATMLSLGLREVCLPHMNRARAARGDELLE